jgi:uncharacterized protein with FMN-binding domain
MKKIASLVVAALVVSSMSGCARYNNQRGANYNQGTAQGTRTGYGTGTTQGTNFQYRDGVYTGEGNRSGSGNQTATVEIRGGRISNITLRTVDLQGRETGSIGNATGYTTGAVDGKNSGNNLSNTTIMPGSRSYGTTGTTGANNVTGTRTGTNTGYGTGTSYGNTGTAAGGYGYNANSTGYGTATGYGTYDTNGGFGSGMMGYFDGNNQGTNGNGSTLYPNGVTGTGLGANMGRASGTAGIGANGLNNGATNNGSTTMFGGTTTRTQMGTTAGNSTTGYNNTTGTNMGTTTGNTTYSSEFERIRRDLVSAMLARQTYDVPLNQDNNGIGENWKLAVRRALDKARLGGATGDTNLGGTAGTTGRTADKGGVTTGDDENGGYRRTTGTGFTR